MQKTNAMNSKFVPPQRDPVLGGIDSHRSGQSMVEILIAIGIIATSISAVVVVAFGNQSAIIDAQNHIRALQIAKTNLEEVKADAKQDFASAVNSLESEDIFLKEIIVEDTTPYEKQIISRITWTTEQLRPQLLELVTIITDPSEVLDQGGDSGGGGLTGDWGNPRTLGSEDIEPGGSKATDVDVKNKIVYISTLHSAGASSDIFIIDATDGENPNELSNLNTGVGLNAIDVAGSYAYGAQNSTSNQLQIIDISDNVNPSLLEEFTLTGVSGPGAIGWSIFYHDSKVFIGTKTATGPEFHVVDVSNPLSPTSLGSYEIGGDINGIHIRNEYAYLATSLDSKELIVLDISNPGSIAEAGSYNAPGSADSLSLYIVGVKVYLGRTLGSEKELNILDVTEPSAVTLLGSKDISGGVTAITVRDYLAFMGTEDSTAEFQVWNISEPDDIINVSTFNFPQVVTGVDYEDNIIYASVRSNDALRIITSAP